MTKLIEILILTCTITLLSACVTVNFEPQDIKKSENISFKQPGLPFKEFAANHLDKAWKNPKNGNSISFLSDCSQHHDPSLTNIIKGVVRGIEFSKTVSSKKYNYNNRAALHNEIKGSVDGVQSRLEVLTFKKNSCIFIITYVALDSTFQVDQKYFKNFLKGFHVK